MFPGISRRRKRRPFLNPYTDNFLDGQADEHTRIRQVIGHPETFREAVEQLDAYGQCQPEHFAHQCPCQSQATKTYSPLAAVLPEHITPELLFLETQWAALVSYGVTAQLLHDVLPIDTALAPCTIREHVFTVAERLERALGEGHRHQTLSL
jgi:hypothetical protein